jgi:hydrogenase nickel incorporation protein HypA/HybF
MHELSIAMSIVELAEEEIEQRDIQIDAVHLKLGALSGVVKEALLSCYEMACENTPLEGSRLVIEDVPIVIFCPSCQGPRSVSSLQLFCCLECGTPSSEIVQGKELEVVALEIVAPETIALENKECAPNPV